MRLSASSAVCDSLKEDDTELVKGFKKKVEVNICPSLKWSGPVYSRNRIFVLWFGLWVWALIKNEFKLDVIVSSLPHVSCLHYQLSNKVPINKCFISWLISWLTEKTLSIILMSNKSLSGCGSDKICNLKLSSWDLGTRDLLKSTD